MQSDSAPEVGGSHPTVASSHPEPPEDDPVRRLLGGPPVPVRQLGLRHWLGIAGLVAAIAAAAFVLPPLITSSDGPPAPQHAAAARRSSDPSPAAVDESPSVPPPAASATAPTRAPATGGPAAPTGGSSAPTGGSSVAAGDDSAPDTPVQPEKAKPGRTSGVDTAPSFKPTTVQAEAASLTGGAEEVECATCKAGARVRWLGQVDVHVTIPSAGQYQITVVYEANGDRSLDVSIDGKPPVATLAVTGTNWTTPRSVTVNAHLPAGSVDIGLSAGAGSPPDVDAVTIS
ncbi:hypothetical protein GCM10023322_08490 [Rugosimonospora acidiphila]|uniref:CBM6 domain-containing protein n=1 Tax=Rugosimonospora acidiphila TaxID=556531 RepID=A0ABP9RJW7_9ACTN